MNNNHCLRCGACCRFAVLWHSPKDLKVGLQEWLDARGLIAQELDKNLIGILIEQHCPHLKDDKDGKYLCDIWGTDKLPSICLEKPNAYALKLFPKCGYNLEIIKTLNEKVNEEDDKKDAIRMKKIVEENKIPEAKIIEGVKK